MAADDDFWKGQFDTAANMPFSWWDKAHSLLTAADVLDQFSGPVADVFSIPERYPQRLEYQQRSVIGVSAMLRAMATECLLKALWLHHGGKLAEAGDYLGILRNEHHLDRLANQLVAQKKGLAFTERELLLLELASYWIMSGRYPVQKNFSYLVPSEREDGTIAPAQYWHGNPFEELKTLINKLDGLLGFTMKFKDESP